MSPFKSVKQQRYLYAHPEKIGREALHEWASKTNFSRLPEKVKSPKKTGKTK